MPVSASRRHRQQIGQNFGMWTQCSPLRFHIDVVPMQCHCNVADAVPNACCAKKNKIKNNSISRFLFQESQSTSVLGTNTVTVDPNCAILPFKRKHNLNFDAFDPTGQLPWQLGAARPIRPADSREEGKDSTGFLSSVDS